MIIALTLLFTLTSAFIDYEHLKDNDYIESHASRWFLRLLFVLAVSRSIPDILGAGLLFTALFDSLLNVMRGKELFYLGKTAYYDRFWRRIPFLFVIFKIVCLFVGIYLLCL
jgi:hypothetical protein